MMIRLQKGGVITIPQIYLEKLGWKTEDTLFCEKKRNYLIITREAA